MEGHGCSPFRDEAAERWGAQLDLDGNVVPRQLLDLHIPQGEELPPKTFGPIKQKEMAGARGVPMMSHERWLNSILEVAKETASRDFQQDAWLSGRASASSPTEIYNQLFDDYTFDL